MRNIILIFALVLFSPIMCIMVDIMPPEDMSFFKLMAVCTSSLFAFTYLVYRSICFAENMRYEMRQIYIDNLYIEAYQQGLYGDDADAYVEGMKR